MPARRVLSRAALLLVGLIGTVPAAVSVPAAAAPLDAVVPKKLRTAAAAHAAHPSTDYTAVVGLDGQVWTGSGKRLSSVASLPAGKSDVVVGARGALAWHTLRKGLFVRTTLVATWTDRTTEPLQIFAPVLDARVEAGRAVVLLPGELLVLGGEAPIRHPLPMERPEFAADTGFTLRASWGAWPLDATTGCPGAVPPERVPAIPSAAARLSALQAACKLEDTVPEDILTLSAADAAHRARRAARRGDIVGVAAQGYRGREVESLRPTTEHTPGVLKFGGLGDTPLDEGLATRSPVAVVHGLLPGTHPGQLVGGDHGAACHGAVVVVEEDPSLRAWFAHERDRLQIAGVSCAEHLHVVAPSDAPARQDAASVRYMDNTGKELGWRSGTVGPGWLRDDLARFGPESAVRNLVTATRPLSAEWSLGPGPGTVITFDVDGSWLAGVGWEVARATEDRHRLARMALGGPVTEISVAQDGRYDVVSGGQTAKVLFEGGQLGNKTRPLEWTQAATLSGTPPKKKGSLQWPASGQGVQVPGGQVVATGGRPLELVTWSRGAVVRTQAGLVGLWPDGEPAWRIPDATAFAFADELIIVATRYGLSAYRPPTTKLLQPKPAAPPDDSEGGDGGGGPGGGGPGGGGPGGGGPGGGGPGGGGPGGGGPGGGDPGGGGPGGGGPGGGGPGGGGPGGGGPGGGGPGGGGPGGGGPGGGGPGGGGPGGGGPGGGGPGGGGPGGGGPGGGGPGGGGPGGGGPGGGGPGGGGPGGQR